MSRRKQISFSPVKKLVHERTIEVFIFDDEEHVEKVPVALVKAAELYFSEEPVYVKDPKENKLRRLMFFDILRQMGVFCEDSPADRDYMKRVIYAALLLQQGDRFISSFYAAIGQMVKWGV